jgi:hypothetical protein
MTAAEFLFRVKELVPEVRWLLTCTKANDVEIWLDHRDVEVFVYPGEPLTEDLAQAVAEVLR